MESFLDEVAHALQIDPLTYRLSLLDARGKNAGSEGRTVGAALWGLSFALHEGAELERGQVKQRNLDSYTPLRMADVPELDIVFIDRDAFPSGLGEPPLISVAPAIGNAIVAATGKRVRDLPIRLG